MFIVWSLLPTEDPAWSRIQQTKTITFATDATFPPFASLDEKGNFFGFDIDLGNELAKRLGVKAEFEAVSYDGLLGTLIVNRDDAVLSAFVIQPERSKDVSYTPSYFNAGIVLVTRVEQDGILLNNLTNKTLSAEYGSEGDALIRKWGRVTVGLKALPMKDSIEAMLAVESGKADGALVDAVSAYQYVSRGESRARPLKISASVPEADAPYVMAVSVKSPILLRELTKALDEIKNDGTMSQLRVKWFGEAAR
ncbi:MAG: amino acid ABC transporter substrate-binding protein [Chloroflexi bacterium]|nr:amino acid ABC transporter substrate-binding protein [Chloroflexota bacterium]